VEVERERLSVGTRMELATRVWVGGGLCERCVFFLCVYASGRVESVNLKASIESWLRLDLLQRPSSSIEVVVDEMNSD
jgi:hypothetical protein